ncbi:DNA-directed RNA polymerase subunit omega [Natronincola ferrireducens]|uniref:DNA-directed RNA polymerase subunit omega n=1 Tax=Natronincola ferrireducens TaxID=393762 RepID=A0A1G9BU81_9FIRM|nr:DNA-directed RNA polymerase subunit omega [Natronincola ferrireducens]SDK42734.1 DNA-directed RNA polymerase subunit omega [Natronincola ferrireducens]
MLYPSTNELMTKVDSRYTLVVAVAKRARQLIDGNEPKVKAPSLKPVSIATHEIVEDVVTYTPAVEEKDRKVNE